MNGKPAQSAALPTTIDELRTWVRQRLSLTPEQEEALVEAVSEVIGHLRRRWQTSKDEAIQAMSNAFADRTSRLQTELLAKDATVSNIARYFEEVVAELTEKAHRDPKTKLMNFDWFMERLESFLGVEQRVRWCAVGVVDITSFKWFNDNLGHAVGDRIIERVALLLRDKLRFRDLIAQDRSARDLHARFGGDEFCFLIPDLPGAEQAIAIATRFKDAVETFDWSLEHPRLAERPVKVDVGVVCLRLGSLEERRGSARALAGDLIQWADRLMYDAKGEAAPHVHQVIVGVEHGTLVELPNPSAPQQQQQQQ